MSPYVDLGFIRCCLSFPIITVEAQSKIKILTPKNNTLRNNIVEHLSKHWAEIIIIKTDECSHCELCLVSFLLMCHQMPGKMSIFSIGHRTRSALFGTCRCGVKIFTRSAELFNLAFNRISEFTTSKGSFTRSHTSNFLKGGILEEKPLFHNETHRNTAWILLNGK